MHSKVVSRSSLVSNLIVASKTRKRSRFKETEIRRPSSACRTIRNHSSCKLLVLPWQPEQLSVLQRGEGEELYPLARKSLSKPTRFSIPKTVDTATDFHPQKHLPTTSSCRQQMSLADVQRYMVMTHRNLTKLL